MGAFAVPQHGVHVGEAEGALAAPLGDAADHEGTRPHRLPYEQRSGVVEPLSRMYDGTVGVRPCPAVTHGVGNGGALVAGPLGKETPAREHEAVRRQHRDGRVARLECGVPAQERG